MNDWRPSLPRFVETRGRTGQLLRQVLAEQEDETLPRFITLRERRSRRLRLQRGAAAITTALLALLAAWTFDRARDAPAIRAELAADRAGPRPARPAQLMDWPAASAAPAPAPAPALALAPAPAVPTAGVGSSDKPKSRAAGAARTGLGGAASPRRSAARAPANDAAALSGAKICAEIARSGAAEQAIACYEALARGGGISAELALFEQARLAGKMLNQPDRALQTLQSHRKRFPQGVLRAEVMLAQIDWLVTSGQSLRALALVDEALRSGLVQERATELEQVRARLEREHASQP